MLQQRCFGSKNTYRILLETTLAAEAHLAEGQELEVQQFLKQKDIIWSHDKLEAGREHRGDTSSYVEFEVSVF
jgi:hypothetical protein